MNLILNQMTDVNGNIMAEKLGDSGVQTQWSCSTGFAPHSH